MIVTATTHPDPYTKTAQALLAQQRLYSLETTALRSPIGGRILWFTEVAHFLALPELVARRSLP